MVFKLDCSLCTFLGGPELLGRIERSGLLASGLSVRKDKGSCRGSVPGGSLSWLLTEPRQPVR